MTSRWQESSGRMAVVRSVIGYADRSRRGDLPWHEAPRAAEFFDTPDDLLRALQRVWITRLTARLDVVLESGSGDPRADVRSAWQDLAAYSPGLRRILDAHADEPALAAGLRTERRFVAVAAGLATLSDPYDVAAGRGEELIGARRSWLQRVLL